MHNGTVNVVAIKRLGKKNLLWLSHDTLHLLCTARILRKAV